MTLTKWGNTKFDAEINKKHMHFLNAPFSSNATFKMSCFYQGSQLDKIALDQLEKAFAVSPSTKTPASMP
jgi:hypothetical protein